MNKIRNRVPRHSYKGEKWKTIRSNKKRLVRDFQNKCAYCDDLDRYSGGEDNYHIDHFAPKSKFKHLEFVYENLMYSCPYCNRAKKDKWVGDNSEITIIENRGFINPCTSEYDRQLGRDDKGNIVPLTAIGKYMHKELKLYLSRHAIIYNLEKVEFQLKRIKKIIEQKKVDGETPQELEAIYKDLCVIFYEYYDISCQKE